MRILKLRFENINSLKGIHEVDFSKGPLSEAGLFAITGPIGAGKSTLLDVTTLALFNRIPRLGVISKANIIENGVVVTRNTDKALAEIEYESKGRHFRSTWRIQKNRNGNFNDYDMEIAELLPGQMEGQIIQSKKSLVPTDNSELIGLTYEQFERSILLCQGEFSKFLKSGKHDRSKLLEQLTGTQVFRRIGIKAFEANRDAKKQIELKEQFIKGIDILSEDKVTELKGELTTLLDQIKKLDTAISTNQAVLNLKQDLANAEKSLKEKREELVKAQNEKNEFSPQEKTLELHLKAVPLRTGIAELGHARKKVSEIGAELEKEKTILSKNHNAKADLIQSVSDFIKLDLNEQSFEEAVLKFREKVQELQTAIHTEERTEKGFKEQILALKAELGSEFPNDIKNQENRVEYLSTLISSCNKRLKSLVLPSNLSRDTFESILSTISEEIKVLEELQRILEQANQLQAKLNSYSEESLKLKSVLPKLEKQIEDLNALISEATQAKLVHETSKKLHAQILDLNEIRKTLKKDEPCPLCGSLEHPLAGTQGEHDDKFDKLIQDQDKQLQKLNAAQLELQKQASQTGGMLNEKLRQIGSVEKELKETQEIISKLRTVARQGESINNVESIIVSKKETLKNISEWQKLNSSVSGYEKLKVAYTGLEESAARIKQLTDQKQAVYPGADIDKKCNAWNAAFTVLLTDLKNSGKRITELTATLNKALPEQEKIYAELNDAIRKSGFSSVDEVTNLILPDSKAEEIQKQKVELDRKLQILTGALNELEKTVEKFKKEDNSPESIDDIKISIRELKESHTVSVSKKGGIEKLLQTNQERTNNQKAEIEALEKLKKDARKWDMINSMIGDSEGNKFCNIVQTITLKQLFVLANARLQALSDRYWLVVSEEGKDDIEIVDRYMGNTRRIAKSLSGGETFLVSLSLALGLSDLASKNVRLDSLFIDEGFGTLDPETLDIAINTLDKLQAETRKTIGVISHVEALKDRISCQIKLKKDRSGHSTMTIGYN